MFALLPKLPGVNVCSFRRATQSRLWMASTEFAVGNIDIVHILQK